MDKTDFQKLSEIANKAISMGIVETDKLTLMMDLECVHDSIGLRLDDMLECNDYNFSHDITGIQFHLNRQTKKLENCFLPRFSK